MQVKDVMSSHKLTIPADYNIHQAAAIMKKEDIGMLPVIGMDGTLQGTLTDRDIAISFSDTSNDLDSSIENIMTPSVISCDANQDIEDAVNIMRDKQLRRLVVTGSDKKPVGVVALADIALKTDDQTLKASLIEDISKSD